LDLIAENIKDPSLREWFMPNFTTTTEKDKVAAAAAAMCTLQEYFTYTINIGCGIPQITLHGTVEDWQNIRTRVERLADFDDGIGILSNEWVTLLVEILDNFIESAENGSYNNLAFWDQIAYSNTFPYGQLFLSGWITTFTFFDKDGQKAVGTSGLKSGILSSPWAPDVLDRLDRLPLWGLIEPVDINPNIMSCPIRIIDIDGEEYNSTLFVGQMAFEHSPDSVASQGNPSVNPTDIDEIQLVKPRTDWAIVVKQQQLVQLTSPQKSFILPDICFEPCYDVWMCLWDSETNHVGHPLTCFPSTPTCADLSIGKAEACQDDIGKATCIDNEGNQVSLVCCTGRGIYLLEGSLCLCFSGENTINEQDRGEIKMRDLTIGDKVQVAPDTFDLVYGFGHYDDSSSAEFLQIQITGIKQPLEISAEHMVFLQVLSKTYSVPASKVEVGDELVLVSNNEQTKGKVTAITTVFSRGLYAPFTLSGKIAVNGVLSSSYVSFTDHDDSGHFSIAGHWTPFTIQWLSHAFTFPRRLICSMNFESCKNETYNHSGMAHWVSSPHQVLVWILRQSYWIQTLTWTPFVVYACAVTILEHLFSAPFTLFLLTATLLTLGGLHPGGFKSV
jgi:hypothetical protein